MLLIKQEPDTDVQLCAHRLQMLAHRAYADTTNDQIQYVSELRSKD